MTVAGLGIGALIGAAVAERLRRALAVGEEAEPAAGQVRRGFRVPAPVGGVGGAQPQPGH